ncbi:MAG: sugar transporter family protein [Holophagaceae bacterium]|nr:sugar transporter family protein [Holophagaceae bacterium]
MDEPEHELPMSTGWSTRIEDGFTRLIETDNLLLSSVLIAFWAMWIWSWLSFGGSFLTQRHGFIMEGKNTLMITLGAGSTLGALLVPALSDRIGRRKSMIAATVAALAGTIAVVAFPGVHPAGILLALFAMTFAGAGSAPILFSLIPQESSPRGMAGTAVGLITGIGIGVGFAFAHPLMSTFAARFGSSAPIKAGLIFLIPMFLLSFFLKETAPDGEEE